MPRFPSFLPSGCLRSLALPISALVISMVLPGVAPAADIPDSLATNISARVLWDFEDGLQNWTAKNHLSSLTASTGCLRGTVSGEDPQVSDSAVNRFSVTGTAGVIARVWVSVDSPIQLYWSNQYGGFADSRMVSQSLPAGQWTTVRFDLRDHPEWVGKTISRIRLDPGVVGAQFAIDYVALVDRIEPLSTPLVSHAYEFDSGMQDWDATSGIGNCRVEDGKLRGTTTTNDPQLFSPDLSASDQGGVILQFKTSGNTTFKLYWATTESGFNENQSTLTRVDASVTWQTLKFDLRSHPYWAGKTITKLRIDPSNTSGQRFEIDSVVVIDKEGMDDADGDLLNGLEELVHATNPAQSNTLGGRLTQERWNRLTHYSTRAFQEHEAFYARPDLQQLVTGESPSLFFGTFYSTRSRGYLVIPQTGAYRFWISAANSAQLLISESGDKFQKRVIAELNPERGTAHGIPANSAKLWDIFDSQMSEEIQLTAGTRVYLEVIHSMGHTGPGHFSIAWAQPGKPRIPLSGDSLLSYHPTTDDADDDFLPDLWETQYGLNPQDNGIVNRRRDGELGDFDSDGLTNREEYLAGTHPASADTDGDGTTDFAEIHTYGTNPLEPAPPREQLASTIPLDSFLTASANWRTVESGGIIADHFRGRIAWQFDAPVDGNWILQAATTLRGTVFDSETVNYKVAIDGRPLGDHPVHYGTNHQSLLRIITPNLSAGTHTLEIYIDNLFARRQIRIDSLQLLQPNGPDDNADGMIDWIAASLGELDQLPNQAATSKTSPFFLEGKSIAPSEVRINGQAAQTGLGSNHWFANLPLHADSPTPYRIQFPTGTATSSEVFWSSTNVIAGGSTTIRAGDALKLGAWVTDGSGQANITITAPGIDAITLGTLCSSTDAASGIKSLQLNGNSNNALRIPDSDALDGTSKLTLSLWVKPDTGTFDSNTRGILSKRIASQNRPSYTLFHAQNGRLFLDLDNGGSFVRHDTGYTLQSDWQFIAVVFDGDLPASERLKFYIDGQPVVTASHPTARISNHASELVIGSMHSGFSVDGSPVSFGGLIDDVRIDRDALSSAQVEAIRITGSTTASSAALIARYDFEQSATPGRDTAVEPITFPVFGTDAVVHPFTNKRTYTITATHNSGATGILTVHARHAVMPQRTTAVQNTLRYLEFDAASVDTSLLLQPGDHLRLGAREILGGARFRHSLYPESGGSLGIAARLHKDGPIVGIASVASATLTDVLQNGVSPSFASSDFPGYYVVHAPIVVTDLPPGATVKITIFRSGVTFLDGSTVKNFTATDFKEGSLLFSFLYNTHLTGGYCHYIDIYDANGTVIGRR